MGRSFSFKLLTFFAALSIGLSAIPVLAKTVKSKAARASLSNHKIGSKSLVNWTKWNADLFSRAQKENKLVILDLEAVWCHWCHVMDQKTYANPAVAKILNEHFIAVKVDQDSRPDLANRYDDYGWPATIIFNSKGEELAKRSGYIQTEDMLSLLSGLLKNPVLEAAAKNADIFYTTNITLPVALRAELIENHKNGYDEQSAGWGMGHKFLDWDSVDYSLARAKEGDSKALQRAQETLLAQINLIDPVWGGVYQYSTDGDWKHQHFEKIMQIQGENLRIYSLAYLYFKDPKFLKAALDIEKYLRKFLMSPDGAFYCSQDADLKKGERSGGYFKLSDSKRRKQGIPLVDKHIYARENAWAISGLSALYMATCDQKYLAEALKATSWIIKNRSLASGGFKHDANDLAAGPYLGDTLYMGRAFLNLYQATGDRQWLQRAEKACTFIAAHFAYFPKNDKSLAQAGYASSESTKLMAEPLLDENVCLARFSNMLYRYTAKQTYKNISENCMKYLSTPEIAHKRKILVAGILLADKEMAAAPIHITVLGAKSDPAARALFQAANKYPVNYKRVEWYDQKEGPMPNPDTDYGEMPKAAVFICANQRCSLPVYSPEKVALTIEKMIHNN